MRKILIIQFFLCLALTLEAQSLHDEVAALRIRNRQLQATVDSLRRVVDNNSPDVFDAWDQLEDMDNDGFDGIGGVGGLMSDEEMDYELSQRIYASSPSLKIQYRSILKKFVGYYISGRRQRSMPAVLGRYYAWLPYFREVFRKYGVPEDLIPLCIVESAVSRKARSKAGALGMWQFMPETARGYGMRVDDLVDQRYDIEKETVAAASFLRNAYVRFGDWTLAVCSYNCGAVNIQKAMVRSGKRDFWGIYDYLPKETRDYVPSLVAAGYVVTYREELGIPASPYRRPAYTAVEVKKDMTLDDVARLSGYQKDVLKKNNPELLTDKVPAGYFVKF